MPNGKQNSFRKAPRRGATYVTPGERSVTRGFGRPKDDSTGQSGIADAQKTAPQDKEDCNLTKYLSTAGIASRRRSAEMIKEGSVTVNGTVETNPGRRILPGDVVIADGKRVTPGSSVKKYYIMLHKPRGYVCTNDDDHAAKKAIDLIQLKDKSIRLFSAGRLDKNSEGLILFSNDGDFVAKLTHPRYKIQKTYEVSTERPFSSADIARMLKGIQNAGDTLRALKVETITPTKYRLVLGEGKNREIRRMMDELDHKTKRLKRVAVGNLRLSRVEVGEWRELTPNELENLFPKASNDKGKPHPPSGTSH